MYLPWLQRFWTNMDIGLDMIGNCKYINSTGIYTYTGLQMGMYIEYAT